MTILLRAYTAADREAAISLFMELNRFEHAISGEALLDRAAAETGLAEAEELVAGGEAALVLADAGGAVAGLMFWLIASGESYVAERLRRYGKVDALVVDDRHRGQGIGTLLLEEAERLTRAAGLTRVMLHVIEGNDGAEATYRRFGFASHSRNLAKDLG